MGGGGEDRSVGEVGRDQTQGFSVLGGDGGATEREGEWTGPGGRGVHGREPAGSTGWRLLW